MDVNIAALLLAIQCFLTYQGAKNKGVTIMRLGALTGMIQIASLSFDQVISYSSCGLVTRIVFPYTIYYIFALALLTLYGLAGIKSLYNWARPETE